MNAVPNPAVAVPLSNEEVASSFAAEIKSPIPSPEPVHAIPVSHAPPKPRGLTDAAYSLFEILLSLIGIVVCLPLMLITAIVICLDSPGPPLFFMKRVARFTVVRGRDLVGRADLVPPPGGYDPDALYYVPKLFTLIKFRTMYRDAKLRFPELYEHKYTSSEDFHRGYFKKENDPRVTRVGEVLRKLSVDELPNFWSVLTGEMRLVGPRPETPAVLHYYSPEELLKFTCKPGITGLAQIGGRASLTWGETLALDVEYVRTRSVRSDLKIILLTIKQVLRRDGAF